VQVFHHSCNYQTSHKRIGSPKPRLFWLSEILRTIRRLSGRKAKRWRCKFWLCTSTLFNLRVSPIGSTARGKVWENAWYTSFSGYPESCHPHPWPIRDSEQRNLKYVVIAKRKLLEPLIATFAVNNGYCTNGATEHFGFICFNNYITEQNLALKIQFMTSPERMHKQSRSGEGRQGFRNFVLKAKTVFSPRFFPCGTFVHFCMVTGHIVTV
jgi:hypothetical protein